LNHINTQSSISTYRTSAKVHPRDQPGRYLYTRTRELGRLNRKIMCTVLQQWERKKKTPYLSLGQNEASKCHDREILPFPPSPSSSILTPTGLDPLAMD
jgi:hypothetical protein